MAGLALLLVSVLVGVVGTLWAFNLAVVGGYALATVMCTMPVTLFGIAHGSGVMLAQSCFKAGWLEVNGATGTRRVGFVLTGGLFAFGGLSAVFLQIFSGGSVEVLPLTGFLFLPMVFSFVATVVAFAVLRSDLPGVR
ncbi:hypothetical protein [Saccharopolyspora gloriosae]|uniref:hypothetical protein n=1 Tax=Saccharopolyspora gloriosae TaxID=455344 RepID=UPI001FB783E2|nr:hypothetical protein [Saccharopolyspora gloriosae]